MKVISISKNGDTASLSLVGCPMRCGYCAHSRQERRDYTLDKLVSEICTDIVRKVYIGGMDPAIQKKELLPLIKTFKQRGLEVTLKTSGNDPEFLSEAKPFVDRFIFEIKAPLDDVRSWCVLSGKDEDWTKGFLERLTQSLVVAQGKQVRSLTRVIPGYMDAEKLERMGQQLRPYVREAVLSQFLANQMNDVPWNDISAPSPPEAQMSQYGQLLVKHIPVVKVLCAGGVTLTYSR